jgi:hypothetical protein
MSVIWPSAVSFLSNMNIKSVHAHFLHFRHALRENGCYRHVVSSKCCHWISYERGKLFRSHLRATLWCVRRCLHGCEQCQRWVNHFKDGNTDIADQPRYGHCVCMCGGMLTGGDFGKRGNDQCSSLRSDAQQTSSCASLETSEEENCHPSAWQGESSHCTSDLGDN